jgi:hypothetical protein
MPSLRPTSGTREFFLLAGRLFGARGYAGPRSSWLSHAKTTRGVFPDVFALQSKKLPYWHYMVIAVSSHPDKAELRAWAERGFIPALALPLACLPVPRSPTRQDHRYSKRGRGRRQAHRALY